MFRIDTTFSILTILVLYKLQTVRALPSIVHNAPAPPPEEGPPQSASALRDKSKLKYEVIGIVGSYLVFNAVLLFLVLTVARRSRRRLQSSNGSLEMEMVAPSGKVNQEGLGTEPSPVSPRKQWASVGESEIKPWTSPTGNQYYHQSSNSASTLNEKGVEREKLRNQQEMERLYAAVLAHEEQKAQGITSRDFDQISAAKSPSRPPPELQHLRTSSGAASTQPLNRDFPHETSPTEPKSPTSSRASSRLAKASPLSFFQSSHSRSSSAASQNQGQKHRPRRMSIRDLSISSPMGTSDLARSATFSDEQPLSPRAYPPGPPPPTPGSQHKSAAATAREAEKNKVINRASSSSSTTTNTTTAATTSTTRAPAPAPIQTTNTKTNKLRNLPFRQHYNNYSQQSAPPTKTTFVERRESLLNPGPKTGQPVPYSPYMPNTPLTPITPGRLVTKEDRKRAKKQNGLKSLAEDEMVKNDEEIWGDGWKG